MAEAWEERVARLGPPHVVLSYEDVERWRGPIVYVWTRGDDVLYVGASSAGLERPLSKSHEHLRNFAPGDRLTVYRASKPYDVELHLIAQLRPRLNRYPTKCPQCGAPTCRGWSRCAGCGGRWADVRRRLAERQE